MPESNAFTVISEQNDHDHATVRAHPRNETYHIVDYADEAARETIAELSAGSVVQLELSRAGRRSNVWRAESIHTAKTDGGRTPDDETST
ncbi:MAG: hypothetical protein PPP55_11290 [Halorubrum sp.]